MEPPTDIYQLLNLKMSTAIPPLLHIPSWRAKGRYITSLWPVQLQSSVPFTSHTHFFPSLSIPRITLGFYQNMEHTQSRLNSQRKFSYKSLMKNPITQSMLLPRGTWIHTSNSKDTYVYSTTVILQSTLHTTLHSELITVSTMWKTFTDAV